MGENSDKNAKKILHHYLEELPKITERQKKQLNQGEEIVKLAKVNGFQVEIRITFQGWQVRIFKGAALRAKSARERPWG